MTNISDIFSITLQGDELLRIHDGHIARRLTYITRFREIFLGVAKNGAISRLQDAKFDCVTQEVSWRR